ncbi:MAG: hypothetical protein PHN37_02525 [Candidatus Pacebacteria bacterium]|nr:hypothetical protein [Candidatus Paceibacterota bacterium]
MNTKKIKKLTILFSLIGGGIMLLLFSFVVAQTSCPLNTTVGETTATLVGEITSHGGDPVLEGWFQYGKTTSYGLETSKVDLSGTGVFCRDVVNLDPCTTYNYRAVARNSAGTAYGENKTFVTQCLPVSVDLKVNNSNGPITVSYQSNVTLTWSSENATSCEASGDWSGTKAIAGSQTIQMNQVKTFNFTLTCQDSTGTKTDVDTVVVNVNPNPPTVITKPAVVTY